MTFEVTINTLDKISSDILLLFTFQEKKSYVPTDSFKALDKILKSGLSHIAQAEHFQGKKKTSFVAHFNQIPASKVLVIGLGEQKDFTGNVLRRVLAGVAKTYRLNNDSLVISLMTSNECNISEDEQSYLVAEGLLLGSYSFTHYKKEDNDHILSTIIFSAPKSFHQTINKGIRKAELYAQGTYLARDLVNEQAAVANPTYLAKVALDIAKKSKTITCKVYDKAEVEKMGMNAFLSIARASATPLKFIYLHYKPVGASSHKNTRKLAIVGKGITFDSGGINVKPGGYMDTMKMDMAGAAAMLGVFSVIDAIHPDFEVIGLAACTPNLISGESVVPGDVVKASNGKTIEILNTDAEGRVTLSDALSYAVKLGATEIIDLATLTGACVVALGTDIAGLMSNDRILVQAVNAAGYDAGDDVWELPLPEDYKELNKSEVADISNLPAGRYAGEIAAGLFLQEFVGDTKWAHLDIAGPAFAEKEYPLGPKGGTGFGVRLLLNYLQEK